MKHKVVVIAHNIRSALNIGSIFRVCDSAGVSKLYITGYSPYPRVKGDKRLNFEIEKIEKKIQKAGLEGFKNISYQHQESVIDLIKNLKKDCYKIVALEQNKNSTDIFNYKLKGNTAIIIGNEVTGVENEVIDNCDEIIEIPMYGKGKSMNVAVSLAVGLYQIKN